MITDVPSRYRPKRSLRAGFALSRVELEEMFILLLCIAALAAMGIIWCLLVLWGMSCCAEAQEQLHDDLPEAPGRVDSRKKNTEGL